MQPLEILNQLQIASPCPASWEAMKGDDRVRFCDSCAKHVYNLAELTAAEAARVLEETEGHPCINLYRRKDGRSSPPTARSACGIGSVGGC